MWGDEITIKLKFSRVTRRVKKTIWHQSSNPGLTRWQLYTDIASWQLLEMTPWIRGWGPDVEVLEPAELEYSLKSGEKN